MALLGGQYEMALMGSGRESTAPPSPAVRRTESTSPLRVPHADGLMQALSAGTLTISLLTQCRATHHAKDERVSHLPLDLGGGALCLGAGPSKDSILITCTGDDGKDFQAEVQYPPSMGNKPGELRLHQLTLSSVRGVTTLRYYANGAAMAAIELPRRSGGFYNEQQARSSGALVFGEVGAACGDGDATPWRFAGAVHLVLLHAQPFSSSTIHDIAGKVMAIPEVWGLAREGDGTRAGAQTHHEVSQMHLEEALVLLDTRYQTHAVIEQSIIHASGALRDCFGDGGLLPPQPTVDEALGSDFTITAVLTCNPAEWPTYPHVLISPGFFDGIHRALYQRERRPAGGGAVAGHAGRDQSPEVHSLIVSRRFSGRHLVRYYVNGVSVLSPMDGDIALSAAPASDLHATLRQLGFRPHSRVDEKSDAARATAAMPSPPHVFFFAMHKQALDDASIVSLSHSLVSSTHTRWWQWGHGKAAVVGGGVLASSAEEDALDAEMGAVHTTPRRRVQPLFKLRVPAKKGGSQNARYKRLEANNGDYDRPSVRAVLELLRNSLEPIRYLLRSVIFPSTMAFHHLKISSSGCDLASNFLFPARLGFTGTPSDLLPMMMGKCGFADGAEGEIFQTLTSPSIVKQIVVEERSWDSLMILDMVCKPRHKQHAALDQPVHALIDTGALITGMSNLDVATYLMENFERHHFPLDGVVYIGDGDVQMIYEGKSQRSIRLADSSISVDHRFCFYDQV